MAETDTGTDRYPQVKSPLSHMYSRVEEVNLIKRSEFIWSCPVVSGVLLGGSGKNPEGTRQPGHMTNTLDRIQKNFRKLVCRT
jgi:hypothetical protein